MGIVGASPKSPNLRDHLAAQDFVYTAVEMASVSQKKRVVNVFSDVCFVPGEPGALVSRMACPTTRNVSLTVTEKGYCHIPSTGALGQDHADVRHDANNAMPRSTAGFVVRGLQERRRAGFRFFTVLSCDNLPDNGRVTRCVVIGLAELIDPSLATWIADKARFPSTMGDRIVPATTKDDIATLASETGNLDQAQVFFEPFLQWVIEDNFVDDDRLAFEKIAGVQMVNDVAPFEFMKIRMLNSTHSALAYLAGQETIADTVTNPVLNALVGKVWASEIIPTLEPPEGVDLQYYADELLARYANPAIRHRTWQIAMDDCQKLTQRILGTIADNVAAGQSCDGLFLAVATWMRYVGGIDEQGQLIDVRDPLADRLRANSDQHHSPNGRVDTLLSVAEVLGPSVVPATRNGILTACEWLTAKVAEMSASYIT